MRGWPYNVIKSTSTSFISIPTSAHTPPYASILLPEKETGPPRIIGVLTMQEPSVVIVQRLIGQYGGMCPLGQVVGLVYRDLKGIR